MECLDESIKNANKLLADYAEKPLNLETQKKTFEENCVYEKAKSLHKLKGQYTGLKHDLLQYQTQMYMMECLHNGQDIVFDDISKELKASRKVLGDLKGDLVDMRDNKKEMCQQFDQEYSQYESLTKELKKLVTEAENDSDTESEEEDDAISETQIERVSEAVQLLQQQIRDKPELWYMSYIQLLEGLTDVKVKCSTPTCITLQFNDQQKPENDSCHNEKLQAQISLCGNKIIDIKLNMDTFDADDVIETAVHENNLQYLESGLHEKWRGHLPLLKEVEILRSRFALDWVQSENLVTVLYGKDTMCTFYVEPGYPASGNVLLRSAVLPDHISKESLKPADTTPSLTQWLQYLQLQLVGPAANDSI